MILGISAADSPGVLGAASSGPSHRCGESQINGGGEFGVIGCGTATNGGFGLVFNLSTSLELPGEGPADDDALVDLVAQLRAG